MAGKYLGPGEAWPLNDEDPSGGFFHEQYALPSNAKIRREYMNMAGDFMDTVFRAANIPPSARVLDFGCGDGTDMIKLQQMGRLGEKTGLEKLPKNVSAAEDKLSYIVDNLSRNGVKDAEVILGDGHNIPEDDDSFDVVIAASVLQEVNDIQHSLDEICRVLVDGGMFIAAGNRE